MNLLMLTTNVSQGIENAMQDLFGILAYFLPFAGAVLLMRMLIRLVRKIHCGYPMSSARSIRKRKYSRAREVERIMNQKPFLRKHTNAYCADLCPAMEILHEIIQGNIENIKRDKDYLIVRKLLVNIWFELSCISPGIVERRNQAAYEEIMLFIVGSYNQLALMSEVPRKRRFRRESEPVFEYTRIYAPPALRQEYHGFEKEGDLVEGEKLFCEKIQEAGQLTRAISSEIIQRAL